MAVNTIIGPAATGKYFFERPEIEKIFWDNIIKSSNILITAPRRVGKTSLMMHYKENPRTGYKVLYIITESVNNENEFFKKVYKMLVEELKGIKKIWNSISDAIKSKKITGVGIDGITIEDNTIIYFDELIKLVQTLNFEGIKIVLMIDEFPQTIENIVKDEDERQAVHFLECNRMLRQIPEITNKIQFVYTGSIGLENIVNRLNCMSTINDLYDLKVHPLSEQNAKELIAKLIKDAGWKLNSVQVKHLLDQVEWLIPYFIQIVIDELDKIGKNENNEVDNAAIDIAFKEAITHRSYFEHWLTRLRNAYKGREFNYAKDLLNYLSEHNTADTKIINNLANKHKIKNAYKEIINVLKHDGYINNNDDAKIYRFNSPLLRMWWYENVAN